MFITIKNKELEDLIVKYSLNEDTLNEVLLNALKFQNSIKSSEDRIKEMMLSVANVILSEIEQTQQAISTIKIDKPVEKAIIREIQTVREIEFDSSMITIDTTQKSSAEEIKEKKKGWIM